MIFTWRHSWLISLLVFISLSGLILIQFNWLKGAIAVREERFQARIQEAMEQMNSSFDNKVIRKLKIHEILTNRDRVQEELLLASIRRVMDSTLHSINLNIEYEFGVQTCKSDNFSVFSQEALRKEILAGQQIRFAQCSFSLRNGQEDHLHLFTFFPSKDQAVFQEMALPIASSILFILILIGAFAYTLYAIFRQKKLTAMKNEFINNLTHEFKTPIASISLAARTLKKLAPVAGSQKAMNYVQLIDQEGKRLENHVDKVLQMAVIDSGNFVLDITLVDVHELIRKVAESLQLMTERKDGSIRLDLLAPQAIIPADAIHLFNILYNLLDNAIQHSGDRPSIRVFTRTNNNEVEIGVADEGIGMSTEVQQQVFEKFYRLRTQNVHNTKGFGLGLSYVKRMTELHGGSISVRSRLGQGTCFTIRLPYQNS